MVPFQKERIDSDNDWETIRVNACLCVKKLARTFAWACPSFLCLILISGCDVEYPADLKYPLRTEPILGSSVKVVPPRFDKPGEFPEHVFDMPGLTEDDKSQLTDSLLNPSKLKSTVRDQLEKSLDELFGSPHSPQVGEIDNETRAKLVLDKKTLAEGSAAYRLHCLHCHGLTGNGRGPTAPWVNPHPRDYRQGIFKFASTQGDNSRKPRREDLLRTLREGIEGTSMPTFALLPENELEAVVSYVIHLSIRGDVEFTVMQMFLKGSGDESDLKGTVSLALETIAGRWLSATTDAALIRPDPKVPLPAGENRAASIMRGYQKFKDTSDAGCIGCHKDYGRQSAFFYDSWGTIGRAADLTSGVYRGGRRPIDFYWRIHSGVNGSNMPAFSNLLKTNDIWDLVNFVQVLPHAKMRKELDIEID
jgi:mono/diheme cytochrome c family protein